ncbi:unnamed protein product [Cuscuta europaea]|uniref:Cyclin n=2 Tax=Cuscuta europaea TaxID=41803 RepID=A0A9P0YSS7_CUSEU|nr:unnamed protein product [Cuscuta europaea]
MEMLAPETYSLNYLRLGLKGSGKGKSRKPQVLSIISMLLESSVKKNEKCMKSIADKNPVTVFHGSRAPALSIQQYVDRIFKYACCSPSCFVVAHIYMEKFIQCTSSSLTSINVHRLLITSVMVAAKFIDDAFFNNAYYARVGGVSTAEMNRLEMKLLFGLDFRLQVSVQTFENYCTLLENEGKSMTMTRSLQAYCGIKESCWSNKEDSTSAQIAR